MITDTYLVDKYSTGSRYISPACIYYLDSKSRETYFCEATIDQIIDEYAFHLMNIPTNRCVGFRIPSDSAGCLRTGGVKITDEEMQWLFIEYKLRMALYAYDGTKVKFIATKIIN